MSWYNLFKIWTYGPPDNLIMKQKPKKLAAFVEVDHAEIKYLLLAMGAQNRAYVSTGSRDFYAEELHDKIREKLTKALESLE